MIKKKIYSSRFLPKQQINRGEYMEQVKWILCPICKNKTRIRIRGDTILINFPLFCPKCKQETLINVKELNMSVIKEPDAQSQSR